MLRTLGNRPVIAAGAPVLIVGFTANAPFDRTAFCRTMPDIVLAGRLIEPYVPGQAILLAPGPMAGSVCPRGFAHLAFDVPAAGAFAILRHRHMDERGAYMYAAISDEAGGTVPMIETAQRSGMLQWPDMLRFAKHIVARVSLAYARLDTLARAAIRV
ncbi:MAG: hypothetical protein RL272_888 [Candidatus Parcubacteria bacterium]|jgi:hypothetical protein